MLEHRVCGALRTSPAVLLGNLKGVSFSAGQLSVQQDRQGIEDLQMILTQQFDGPIYRDFLMRRWVNLMGEFGELKPDDRDTLLYPTIRLRSYQILDKAKMISSLLEAWNAGAITYSELRSELGMSGADANEVIAQWQEDRRRLGLPDVPTSGAAQASGPSDDDKDDDSDDDDKKDDDDGDA